MCSKSMPSRDVFNTNGTSIEGYGWMTLQLLLLSRTQLFTEGAASRRPTRQEFPNRSATALIWTAVSQWMVWQYDCMLAAKTVVGRTRRRFDCRAWPLFELENHRMTETLTTSPKECHWIDVALTAFCKNCHPARDMLCTIKGLWETAILQWQHNFHPLSVTIIIPKMIKILELLITRIETRKKNLFKASIMKPTT
jgi:hypothetical protein